MFRIWRKRKKSIFEFDGVAAADNNDDRCIFIRMVCANKKKTFSAEHFTAFEWNRCGRGVARALRTFSAIWIWYARAANRRRQTIELKIRSVLIVAARRRRRRLHRRPHTRWGETLEKAKVTWIWLRRVLEHQKTKCVCEKHKNYTLDNGNNNGCKM